MIMLHYIVIVLQKYIDEYLHCASNAFQVILFVSLVCKDSFNHLNKLRALELSDTFEKMA